MEISEISENHLKAIVGGRQVAGRDGFSDRVEKRGEKDTGRRKSGKKQRTELALGGGEC